VGRVREEKRRRKKLREEKESEERRCRRAKRIMFWGSGGSKRRLAKAAGAEPSGEMRDEKLHAVVAHNKHISKSKCTRHLMLGKLKCPQTTILGAKHISKSKCTKHLMLGKLFEVKMSKKCTALWREAHFQVKTRKTHHAGSTLGS